MVDVEKPGPWTGVVLDKILEWQLDHPEGDKAACEEWLREECRSGRIDVQELIRSSSLGGKRVQDGEDVFPKKARLSR